MSNSDPLADRPSGTALVLASILAMLVSLPTMGAAIMILVWIYDGPHDVGSGAALMAMGAIFGLLGALPGSPVAVLTGTLLFLLFGRALASVEASTGLYKRAHWLGVGATVGALVATVMVAEEAFFDGVSLTPFSYSLPLYPAAMLTGMIGMLVWRSVVGAVT